MNMVFLIGNLTRDPEMRQVQTARGITDVCSFTLAVNRRVAQGQHPEADYFRVTVWGAMGVSCGKYLAKGRKACVIGIVSCRTYNANDGTVRASLEVTAENVEFLTPRADAGSAAAAPVAPADDYGMQPVQMGVDELPF